MEKVFGQKEKNIKNSTKMSVSCQAVLFYFLNTTLSVFLLECFPLWLSIFILCYFFSCNFLTLSLIFSKMKKKLNITLRLSGSEMCCWCCWLILNQHINKFLHLCLILILFITFKGTVHQFYMGGPRSRPYSWAWDDSSTPPYSSVEI